MYTEEGNELFRIDSPFNEDPFTVNDTVFRDSIIDQVRYVKYLNPELIVDASIQQEFRSPIGLTRMAEVEITDEYTIYRRRVAGGDTTYVERTYSFLRSALFLKLGSDYRPYAGWKMYGYNGGGPFSPMRMSVADGEGTIFPGDTLTYTRYDYFLWDLDELDYVRSNGQPIRYYTKHSYLPLEDVALLAKGATLTFSASDAPPESQYLLLSLDGPGGFGTTKMTRTDASRFSITLQSRPTSLRYWNVAFVQEYRRAESQPHQQALKGWCVPYRIEQER